MSDLLKVKVGGSSYLCKWKPVSYVTDFTNFNITEKSDYLSNGKKIIWNSYGSYTMEKRIIGGKSGLFVTNNNGNAEGGISYGFLDVIKGNHIKFESEFCITNRYVTSSRPAWASCSPTYNFYSYYNENWLCFAVSNSNYSITQGRYVGWGWDSPGISGQDVTIYPIDVSPIDLNTFYKVKFIIDKSTGTVEYYLNDALCVTGVYDNFQRDFYINSKQMDIFVTSIRVEPI